MVYLNPGQIAPGSNGDEGVLHIFQSSRTGASPSDGLVSYPEQSLDRVGGLIPLQRCRRRILQPQPTKFCVILERLIKLNQNRYKKITFLFFKIYFNIFLCKIIDSIDFNRF